MLSGTPTQTKTSVATLAELSGLIDAPYADGEFAYVRSLDVYFRLNRGSSSGVATRSGAGSWTVYSGGAATLSGQGPPTIDPVVGAIYVDTLSGDLYSGIANPTPAWILSTGSGSGNATSIQGVPVSATPPVPGQALVDVAGVYTPSALPAGAQRATFLFSSGSPFVIAALPAGSTVLQVTVVITTAFNDPAATMEVGTFTDPGAILPVGDIVPQLRNAYASAVPTSTAIPDQLILTIAPAASTQGAGYLTYTILPP